MQLCTILPTAGGLLLWWRRRHPGPAEMLIAHGADALPQGGDLLPARLPDRRCVTSLDARLDGADHLVQVRDELVLGLHLDGRAVTPRIFTFTAVWYSALRTQPVRIVVVRDPSRRGHTEAFFCTDVDRDAVFILATYSRRWTLEVTFHDAKQHLGFGQAQNQTLQAVARTAPFAGLVYTVWVLNHELLVAERKLIPAIPPAGDALLVPSRSGLTSILE